MDRRAFLKVSAAGVASATAATLSSAEPSNAAPGSKDPKQDARNVEGGDRGVAGDSASVRLQRYKLDYEQYWDDAFARAFAESRDIVLPGRRGDPMTLRMAERLVVPAFTRIVGQGHWGSRLDFSDAPGNGIEFSADAPGFTHGVWLENFSVHNAPQNGVYVNTKLAEEVWFNHIMVGTCGANGFFFDKGSSGTTPLNLGHLSVFSNGNAGVYMRRTHQRTAIRIQSVSGDNNREALLRFNEGLGGGSVSIGHWKCEVGNAGRAKRAVLSEAGQGSYIHLGNGFIWAGEKRPQSRHAAIENLGGGRMAWDKIGFDELHHDFWPAGYVEDGAHPLTMTPLEVQGTSFTNLPRKVWPGS